MTIDIHRPKALLVLFAVAVLAAGLLALVEAKSAWAADRSFEPAPSSPIPVGFTPTTVTNADFNADGKMDLAAQNAGSNNVSVRLGNGDGTFQAKPDIAVGSGPTSVISADFNADSIADLAVSNQNSNNVSVLLGQDLNGDGKGDGTFQTKQDFSVGLSPTSVISADFNGDQKADLAVANQDSDDISVLLGNGNGTFQSTQPSKVSPPCISVPCLLIPVAAPNQVIAADFNGDSKSDLATANVGRQIVDPILGPFSNPGGVTVLLGKGDGTFQTPKEVMRVNNSDPVLSITAANLDAGSSMDLVATKATSNVVSVLKGNGEGTFQTPQSFGVGLNPSAVTNADLDGDAKADDLAVSNYGSANVSVLFNNDSGGFQAAQNYPAGNGPAFVIGANFNADSFADLAVANQNSNNVSVLLNTEPPPPPPETTITSGPSGTVNSTSATFEFSSSEPGSTFQCALDSDSPSAYSPCTSPKTVPDEGLLADGSHTFYVKATGAAGNNTDLTAATRTWTVDTTAPDTTIDSGPSGTITVADATFTFSSEAGATFECRHDGAVYTACTSPKSYTKLSNGSHTFDVRSKDGVGNVDATPASRMFTVEVPPPPQDTTAPRVSTATPTGTGVARGTNAIATFSERMDPTTITTSTFKLFKCSSTTSTNCATQITNVTIARSTDRLKATLNPYGTSSTLLAGRTKYKVVVTVGAKDEAGNQLDQDRSAVGNQQKVWYFTSRT